MKMTMEAAEQFLRILGVPNIQKDTARGWVRASCPLAPWKHKNGQDRNPSFAIKISEKAPWFHCFSCDSQGMLPKLVATITWLSGVPQTEASEFLGRYELFGDSGEVPSIQVGRRIRIRDRFQTESQPREVKRARPVPQEILDKLPLIEEACEYSACEDATRWLVTTRKVSVQSIADYQLRVYEGPNGTGIVFPLISRTTKEVMDLWVRMLYADSHTGSFRLTPQIMGSDVDYHAPNLWFGQHLYVPDRPLILVEGALDAMRLRTLFPGINVVASMGPPSSEQLSAIHGRVILLGFDSDEAGKRYALRAYKAVDAVKVSWLNWSLVGIKDPGDLESAAQFREVYDKRKTWNKVPQNPDPVGTRKVRQKRSQKLWMG